MKFYFVGFEEKFTILQYLELGAKLTEISRFARFMFLIMISIARNVTMWFKGVLFNLSSVNHS